MINFKKQETAIWFRCLLVSFICFIVSMALHFFGVFNYFENKAYDLRMMAKSEKKEPCDDIFFIKVDQESITWAKETYGWDWPWPREAYARMIDFLSAGNPKSIAIDIVFSESSVYGDRDDFLFGEAEKKSGKVIQTIYIAGDRDDGSDYAQVPIPMIADNAAMLANVNGLHDSDDIVRRGRLDYEYNGNRYPSLGTAPLFLNNELDYFDEIPRLKDGSVLLSYQKSMDDYLPYSAMNILKNYDAWMAGEEGDYGPEEFQDSYIYIAYYATGLFDICSTPVSQVYPGVGVHITVLDNYLTQGFMRKVSDFINFAWYLSLSLLSGLCIAFSFQQKRQWMSLGIMIIGIAVLLSGSVLLPYHLFMKGFWIEIVGPIFNLSLSLLSNISISYATEGKQKRIIKNAFSMCLSKDVVNKIIEDPSSFVLGGNGYEMSAIFTDLQKFSTLCDYLTPLEVEKLLNFYLTPMTNILIESKGTLDKYEGDAIIGFIGAPVKIENHADRACSIAILMKKKEEEMNDYILKIASSERKADMNEDLYNAFVKMKNNNISFFTRIGINSGIMIAGFFGSERFKHYTMMGTEVNIASRLEGINKQYHTNGIIISESTKRLLSDNFVVRSLDRVQVVNIDRPIQLYELLDFKNNTTSDYIEEINNWEKAIELFKSGDYNAAYSIFKKISEDNKEDHVADYYIGLLEKYFLKGIYPTHKDGEGIVFDPDEKIFILMQK